MIRVFSNKFNCFYCGNSSAVITIDMHPIIEIKRCTLNGSTDLDLLKPEALKTVTDIKRNILNGLLYCITKTRLFKYIENFTSKNIKFSDKKKSDIFNISAQNIDCVYSLEPPWRF